MNDEAARQGRPDTSINSRFEDSTALGGLFDPPRLVIVLPLEGRPIVRQEAATEGQERRLEDWIKSRPPLLQLVTDALELLRRAA